VKSVALAMSFAAAVSGGWQELPPLPLALGGQMVGVSRGALVVAGGSRFDKPPYEGGAKEWVDTIQVFDNGWKTFRLPWRRAYGCAASDGAAVWLFGGSDERGAHTDVARLEWTGSEIQLSAGPALPRAVSQAGCAQLGTRVYLVGGAEQPRGVLMLDLSALDEGWRELAPLPGPGRLLPVCGAIGDTLYVFGGAELGADGKRRYLNDGWRLSAGQWTKAPELPRPVVAAPALSRDGRITVFGGDDGSLDGRMAELKERHPGFSRAVLEFDGQWRERAQMPVSLVTTGAALWQDQLVVAGGEDRPGHRSARVLGWRP